MRTWTSQHLTPEALRQLPKRYIWLLDRRWGRYILTKSGLFHFTWADPSPWQSLWRMAGEHPDDFVIDPLTGVPMHVYLTRDESGT